MFRSLANQNSEERDTSHYPVTYGYYYSFKAILQADDIIFADHNIT